jgi:protoheme IX farnesyltransferase
VLLAPPLALLAAATAGIALVAGAAAAFNCLVEQRIDAAMARTRWRPTVVGTISTTQVLPLSGAVGGLGLAILWHAVNPLTMWLTAATFVGYAVIYTVILKPATPQNIVIGGASGAMPPVLGWAAVAGDVELHARRGAGARGQARADWNPSLGAGELSKRPSGRGEIHRCG